MTASNAVADHSRERCHRLYGHTDTHRTYRRLRVLGFDHGRINHDKNEWKRGIHHTNTIEGFWSHLKRGIKSTHASVSKKHLQKYVDEFAFRHNNREAPAEMFQRLVRQVSKAVQRPHSV